MSTPGETVGRYACVGAVVVALGVIGTIPAAASSEPLLGIAAESGQFQAYSPDSVAVTYDQTAVPLSAQLFALNLQDAKQTVVLVGAHGLSPSRQYGAHVHTKPCGPNPADAGPHYQNVPDPHQPSTDPAYANNSNEIWLDFTTDAQGNGMAMATVNWRFSDAQQPRSVVIHEHHTHDGGAAGVRLACMTTAF
jgi:Cu-Zn family superoxide dismutase